MEARLHKECATKQNLLKILEEELSESNTIAEMFRVDKQG